MQRSAASALTQPLPEMQSSSFPILQRIGAYASVFFLAFLLIGCFGNRSGSDNNSDDASASEQPAARGLFGAAREGISAARGMAEAVEAFAEQHQSGVTYETVDFRELRDLLPEATAGLERTDIQGERQNIGGAISVSRANATYQGAEDNSRINISIMDGAGAVGTFAFLGAAWTMVDVDRESSDGFERTSTFEGHKSFEKYSERDSSAELSLVIANRFLVNIEGRNVSMDDVYRAARDINLGGLEAMREAGRVEVES